MLWLRVTALLRPGAGNPGGPFVDDHPTDRAGHLGDNPASVRVVLSLPVNTLAAREPCSSASAAASSSSLSYSVTHGDLPETFVQ